MCIGDFCISIIKSVVLSTSWRQIWLFDFPIINNVDFIESLVFAHGFMIRLHIIWLVLYQLFCYAGMLKFFLKYDKITQFRRCLSTRFSHKDCYKCICVCSDSTKFFSLKSQAFSSITGTKLSLKIFAVTKRFLGLSKKIVFPFPSELD